VPRDLLEFSDQCELFIPARPCCSSRQTW